MIPFNIVLIIGSMGVIYTLRDDHFQIKKLFPILIVTLMLTLSLILLCVASILSLNVGWTKMLPLIEAQKLLSFFLGRLMPFSMIPVSIFGAIGLFYLYMGMDIKNV